jgi:hypothetical protein
MVVVSAVWVSAMVPASLRTASTSAWSAAYSAIPRPPWWCRIISRRNCTSNAVPDRPRSSVSSSSVAMPGMRVSPPMSMPSIEWPVWASSSAIQAITSPPEDGSPHSDSQPSIRPAWLVWVEEMSKASDRISGSSLRSSATLAISTPCR